jgi:hypothetical protein|tara:strand:+ start:471 stop:1745 length:1275 start_codon:yes stop_codon:yes gene_type:complete
MALPVLTPSSQTSKVILPVTGNYDNVVSTAVPYGVYLSNTDFISGAVDQVSLTYKMLGGDVLDIELTEQNIYSAYEMSVLEYSSIINSHQAENVLSDFLGATTGTFDHDGSLKPGALSSSLSGSQVGLKYPAFSFEYGRRIATGLAQEAGFGDNVTMYSASFNLSGNVQTYDLQNIISSNQHTNDWADKINNKKISIHRVYYKSPATMWRFYGGFGAGGAFGNLSTYGMYADDSTFELVPAWQNKLQGQTFETDLYTRASHYSYEVRNNNITIYPAPQNPGNCSPEKMWFLFTAQADAWEEDPTSTTGVDGINNMNTLPFANIPYENINSMGKQWIRKYGLAVAKEMLGQVRGKFGTIPIPGNDVTLNSSDLLSQAKEEQSSLKEELRSQLDKLTYGALVKSDAEMADAANQIMTHVPMGVYIG